MLVILMMRSLWRRGTVKAYGNDSCIFDPFGRTGRPVRPKGQVVMAAADVAPLVKIGSS
jgi:hypothetical protein